ncbi:MAG: hypothetical protein IIX88_03885, partial [Firmicutes bacterium]|nr:hypothetical protein [Bacillota bacterium]
MKINETKRFISFLLVVVMLFGMMPTTTGVVYGADSKTKQVEVGRQVVLSGEEGNNHSWKIGGDGKAVTLEYLNETAIITGEIAEKSVTVTHSYKNSRNRDVSETWTVNVV